MNRPHRRHSVWVSSVLAASLALVLAAPGDARSPSARDWARCAEIAAADARLGCYDALAGRPADHTAPGAAATSASPAPAPSSAVAHAASDAAASSAADPHNFGLSQSQLHAVPEGPAAVQARITQITGSQDGRTAVVLDNGQIWVLTDSVEDARLGAGDQVTIKRASLGSFLMLTPTRRSYHVRRTR